jgi:hypothetical protein
MRAAELEGRTPGADQPPGREVEREVYQDRYLIRRPLLQALQAPAPGAVLLIDEVDRADEPFEAFLLEYLGEYQVSIPEIGTVRAPCHAGDHPHQQPHPRPQRRRQAPLPLPLARLPRARARTRHRAAQVPQASAGAVAAGGRVCRPPAQPAVCQRLPARARALPRAWSGPRRWWRWTPGGRPGGGGDTAGILFKQREDVAALTHSYAASRQRRVPTRGCWRFAAGGARRGRRPRHACRRPERRGPLRAPQRSWRQCEPRPPGHATR